jgi:hypothetical protein
MGTAFCFPFALATALALDGGLEEGPEAGRLLRVAFFAAWPVALYPPTF